MTPYTAYENFKKELAQYDLTPEQYLTACLSMAELLNI